MTDQPSRPEASADQGHHVPNVFSSHPATPADGSNMKAAEPAASANPSAGSFPQPNPSAQSQPSSAPETTPAGAAPHVAAGTDPAPAGAPLSGSGPSAFSAPGQPGPVWGEGTQHHAFGPTPGTNGDGAGGSVPGRPVAWAPAAPAKQPGASRITALLVAAALIGGGAGLGGAALYDTLTGGSNDSTASGPGTVTITNPDSIDAATAVAAKVVPSVVTIDVSGRSGGGSGSGVILDTEGHVLTNAHVVTLDGEVADPRIMVTTSDGRLVAATIVGVDPVYDLAVIKLADTTNLTPIEIGDSDTLNVGSVTVAVGAPLGLSNSVTTGIVSALDRSIQIQSAALPSTPDQSQTDPEEPGDQDQPFQFDLPGQDQGRSGPTESISIAVIQTDAAINPGNSGGALVNDQGELIGINVAIASTGGSAGGSGQAGSIGLGFAIPSNIADRVASEIIETGEATHGLLGASVRSSSVVQGSPVVGASIAEVTSGGAADEAGLRPGDIVTEFNGSPITSATDLTAQVRAAAAGSEAQVTYVREGKTETATATLGTLTF